MTSNPEDIVSLLNPGYESEGEIDTRKLVLEMSRKNKKGGAFESLG